MSEQESAVDRLVELAADAEVDLVVIAGDLYDRAIPPADAVGLFDDAFGTAVLAAVQPVPQI